MKRIIMLLIACLLVTSCIAINRYYWVYMGDNNELLITAEIPKEIIVTPKADVDVSIVP